MYMYMLICMFFQRTHVMTTSLSGSTSHSPLARLGRCTFAELGQGLPQGSGLWMRRVTLFKCQTSNADRKAQTLQNLNLRPFNAQLDSMMSLCSLETSASLAP